MMIGFVLVTTLFGIVFTMYTQGNKTSAKAAWRIQTSAKLREGLRVIKSLLEKSSYPTVIQSSDYVEADHSLYWLVLGSSGTVGAAGATGLTDHTFAAAGEVMRFHTCIPRRELGPTIQNGTAFRQVFVLVAGTSRIGNLNLLLREENADVTLSGTAVQVGGFTGLKEKLLVPDVENLVISTATTTEKSVLQVAVTCRDPFDGMMRLTDVAKAQVNVEIH